MPFFETLSPYVMNLACFLFAFFTVCFIFADAFMSIVYLAPKSINHIRKKELRLEGLWVLLRKPLVLLGLAALLVIFAYMIEPSVGQALLSNPAALFCWAMIVPVLLFVMIFRRENYLDDFYMNIFMEFATTSEQVKYANFIERVDLFSIADAQATLEHESLSYLEQKVLKERILMLSETRDMLV